VTRKLSRTDNLSAKNPDTNTNAPITGTIVPAVTPIVAEPIATVIAAKDACVINPVAVRTPAVAVTFDKFALDSTNSLFVF